MEITRAWIVGARPKSQVFFIRHFTQKSILYKMMNKNKD